MPLKLKNIPKLCEICRDDKEENFTTYVYNICKTCKKTKNMKSYLCEICGVVDKVLFYEGRYNNCKKCFNAKKNENKKIEKIREASYIEAPKPEAINVKTILENYILTDYKIFQGYTIKQVMDDYAKEISNLKAEIEKLKVQNEELTDKHYKTNEFIHSHTAKIDDSILVFMDKIKETKNQV
jgi:hypothetical protein